MLYHAKNGTLKIGNDTMDYIRFGNGKRVLLILPGLGDGLQTVKGTALPMALMYRLFAKEFTVYAFSRRNHLPSGYTTRDMARDQAEAMDLLGIDRADVFGVSMGGMIAQHLAIDHPEKVNNLILTVTCARPNPILLESVEECEALFADLCTRKEVANMAERLYAAQLLLEGKTYNQVISETSISSATLSRISQCVQYGKGYSSVLKK